MILLDDYLASGWGSDHLAGLHIHEGYVYLFGRISWDGAGASTAEVTTPVPADYRPAAAVAVQRPTDSTGNLHDVWNGEYVDVEMGADGILRASMSCPDWTVSPSIMLGGWRYALPSGGPDSPDNWHDPVNDGGGFTNDIEYSTHQDLVHLRGGATVVDDLNPDLFLAGAFPDHAQPTDFSKRLAVPQVGGGYPYPFEFFIDGSAEVGPVGPKTTFYDEFDDTPWVGGPAGEVFSDIYIATVGGSASPNDPDFTWTVSATIELPVDGVKGAAGGIIAHGYLGTSVLFVVEYVEEEEGVNSTSLVKWNVYQRTAGGVYSRIHGTDLATDLAALPGAGLTVTRGVHLEIRTNGGTLQWPLGTEYELPGDPGFGFAAWQTMEPGGAGRVFDIAEMLPGGEMSGGDGGILVHNVKGTHTVGDAGYPNVGTDFDFDDLGWPRAVRATQLIAVV